MKTYLVKPTSGADPFEIQADRAEYDKQSGATLFYNGEGDAQTLVARELNVSFCEKQAPAE